MKSKSANTSQFSARIWSRCAVATAATWIGLTSGLPVHAGDFDRWLLNGSAALVPVLFPPGNKLQLTTATPSQAGSAWAPSQISLTSDFSVSFSFLASGGSGGNGLAFVLQNSVNSVNSTFALGSDGSGLGYSGIANSAAIVFDTPGQNVGIGLGGDLNPSGSAPYGLPADVSSLRDQVVYAWVDYSVAGKSFSAFLSSTNSKPATELFSYALPVHTLGATAQAAWLGFTAGTGVLDDVHTVQTFNKAAGDWYTVFNFDTVTVTLGDVWNVPGHTYSNQATGVIYNYGVTNILSGNTLENVAAAGIGGGQIYNHGSLNVAGSLSNATDAVVSNFGKLNISVGGSLTNTGLFKNGETDTPAAGVINQGTLVNHGTLDNHISLTPSPGGSGFLAGIMNAGTLDNHGALNNLGAFAQIDNGGLLTNTAGGVITNEGRINNLGGSMCLDAPVCSQVLGGVGTINNSGVIHNSGTLRNEGTFTNTSTGIVDGTGAYVQYAGTTSNDGSMSQASFDFHGGVVVGTGTFIGTVNNDGAVFAPGHSPGTLTIEGDYHQSGTGTLVLEIESGSVYDHLVVHGNANFTGGGIELRFLSGFHPAIGDSFSFIATTGSLTGWDASLFTYTGLDGYTLAFDANGGSVSVSSITAAVPEPETYALMLAGLALLGGFAKRRGASARSSGPA